MKYVKMLGLAAIAAAALMAFVGASTASATVLCKTEGTGTPTGTTCPPGQAYEGGTTIHAVLDPETGPAKLVTSFKTIECEESTVSVVTRNEGSATETVIGDVEEPEEGGKKVPKLTFGKCNCEVNVLKGGSLEIHWIEGSHNGTLTSSEGEVTITCSTVFGNVHCIYKTNATDLGKLTGGPMATMDIEKSSIPRLTTNALCSEKAEWSAKYTVTSPEPLYVTGHT